jgi:hypothetical protein
MHDGDSRSERIIGFSMKVSYVPEEDLLDLAHVYDSTQVSELRSESKEKTRLRRCLRSFYNDGSRVADGTGVASEVP